VRNDVEQHGGKAMIPAKANRKLQKAGRQGYLLPEQPH
jgi:hypothetical protein